VFQFLCVLVCMCHSVSVDHESILVLHKHHEYGEPCAGLFSSISSQSTTNSLSASRVMLDPQLRLPPELT
jgi:hypothetical protein